MEQAIRAELWEVLDTSDLESITSKEVGRVGGPGLANSWSLSHLLPSSPEPPHPPYPGLSPVSASAI